jgi:type I restriction enzyme S subunit
MTELAANVLPVQSVSPASLGPGAFRYIDIASIDREQKAIVNPALVDNQDAPSRARQLVSANDVLVSTVRPNLNAVAYVPRELDGAVASTGFTVLRPDSRKLDSRYLYHWVRTQRFVDEMTRLATGASYPAVSDSIVKRSEIPLPPVKEQMRIAEVLDRADALRQMRRIAIQKLDSLLQSVFLDMFGDPNSNPKKINQSRFGDVFKSVRYGTGSPPEYVESGNPFIRATNVKRGTVIRKDLKFISDDEAKKIAKCKVSFGDLVVVRSGVNSGDSAMIPKEFDGAYAAYDLVVELDYHDAVFYNFLINSAFGKQSMRKVTRRAAQPHLNADQLREMVFFRPSEPRRGHFVAVHERIDTVRSKFTLELENLNNLFNSIQQRAFNGELFQEDK